MLHEEVPVRRCLMHYNPLTMISTESLSQEWLETVSKELGYPDKGLLEKAIRNFVVGIDIDYEVLGADNGMLMATASGTAVIID